MQSDNNFEIEPAYDPDDWGAPLPVHVPKASEFEGATPNSPSGSVGSHDKNTQELLTDEGGLPKPISAEKANVVPENGEMAQLAPTGPGKRRRRPATPVAGGPAIVLPHAAKRDLFPALFCRSALFRVSGADDPATEPDGTAPAIAIAAQGGVDMMLRGPWPRMRDKAVWEVALEMAKASPNAAAPIPVNLSQFADRLGYADRGSDTLEWIWTSLRRLSHCEVEFDSPLSSGPRIVGRLLGAAREAPSGKEIEIDSALAPRLLSEDFQFAIDRERRATLSTSLARWLHDFLSTHSSQSRPFGVPYLRTLCGYGGENKRFPRELERALSELVQKAPELLARYLFEKPTRSSDGWTVFLTCGEEKRRFEQPKPGPKLGATRGSSSRGGVAL